LFKTLILFFLNPKSSVFYRIGGNGLQTDKLYDQKNKL